MPGNPRLWKDQETRTFLTTLLNMGGKELMAERSLRTAAFTLAHAKVNRDHGRDFSYTQITDKYRSLKRGYESHCNGNECQNASPGSASPSVKKAKGVSDMPSLPFFKERSLLFGDPTTPRRHRRRGSGAAIRKSGSLKINEERIDKAGTPSKAGVIDLTIEDVAEQPAREIISTPARKRNASAEVLPPEPGTRSDGGHRARDSPPDSDLGVTTPNAISRTERVVSILMEEYQHILDDEEMGDCLAIIEDDKKASIFLSITKNKFRDNWLKKQILLFRGI